MWVRSRDKRGINRTSSNADHWGRLSRKRNLYDFFVAPFWSWGLRWTLYWSCYENHGINTGSSREQNPSLTS